MKIRALLVSFEDELQLLPSPRVPEPPLVEWKWRSATGFSGSKEMPDDCVVRFGYIVTPKRPLPANRRAMAKQLSSGARF